MNVVSIRRGEDELRQAQYAAEDEEQGAQLKRLYSVFLRRWRDLDGPPLEGCI